MLSRVGIAVALILAPSLALAAANDVTLTTDTVLSVAGITLNVTGTSATVESITVDTGSFNFTLQSGSTIEITAPGNNRLTADSSTDVVTSTCTASASVLKFNGATARTVTVTPSGTLCSSSAGAGAGSSSGSSGSTGGGSSTVTTTTTTATTTPVTTTVTATPAVTTTVNTPSSGLTASQVQSILTVLASFNVDAATMASVRAALEGTSSPGSVTSTAVAVFKSNLTVGSLGSEVKALQMFLNSHGYPVASSGPGSAGKETTKFGAATKAALIKFQKAKGITPAVGYFGEKTRKAVNAE